MNEKIIEAVSFAFYSHNEQYRKSSMTPYIVHPLGVMNLLLQEQAENPSLPDEVIIAGVLHDVVEDCGVTLDAIKCRFGGEVARLVNNVSEPDELKKIKDKKGTWKERKLHTIKLLEGLDRDSKILSCADKYHNTRSMKEEQIFNGSLMWDTFNASKEDIKWFHKSCLGAYSKGESIEDTKVFVFLEHDIKILFD